MICNKLLQQGIGGRMRRLAALFVAVLLLAGCADEARTARREPLVVTTVAPITDLVARVAGDAAEVFGLVPHGTDSHTFEPGARDAALLEDARVFIANGLHLEEPSLRLAEANLPEGAPIVRLGEGAIGRDDWVFDRSFPASGGLPNPHLWLDVVYARRYVEQIVEALSDVLPAEAAGFRARGARLSARLAELHEAIKTAVATIPEDNRKLLTYHDSWAYFGPRYGLHVVAAVQPPGLSEPSAAEVRAVIDQIRAESVPAVFGSEVFPDDVLQAIAAETGARFVGDLADDALPGEPGTPEHSYTGMMVRNVIVIVESLGGDAAALRAVSQPPPLAPA
jgi:zinc/manganese transport system substrate-binding protein